MRIRTRYLTLAVLFLVTAVSFADRSMLSLTGSAISRDLRLTPVELGYIFSAFGWAYAAGQVPGGWLLDRFGSRRIYILSVFSWSVFVFLQALVGYAHAAAFVLFALLFLMGLCEAPVFPANSRVVAAWFPATERGTAAAVFNSAQYFAAALFGPLMGWTTHALGWKYVFLLMGAVGFAATVLCVRSIYPPRRHPKISVSELEHIEQGGALVDMDRRARDDGGAFPSRRETLKILLGNRMLVGVYIGTFCVTAVMYFFLTWLPIYLQARGMSILKAGAVIALPALCGFSGGISGGTVSDYLLRKGHSLTFARKAPIVVGMLLVLVILACNYVSAQWAVVLIVAFAYFGKAFGSLGWAVIADAAPKQIAGLTAGVFNTFANIAAITTPIVIGYIVQATGSFKGVMIFLAANALAAIFSYLLIVGEIKRVELH